jgi:hypothetical protein
VATYRAKLDWWAEYRCAPARMVPLNINGRYPVRVADVTVDAVYALEHAMLANGYRTPMGATGSYLCRNIGGTSLPSLHSFGIAIDWDYPSNPHLKQPIPRGFGTDPRFEITEAQVNAVEAIVNDQGDSIWKSLIWSIGDTMHFEIDVPPDRCQPATPNPEEDDVDTPRWASRLRNPLDFDRMAELGIITHVERDYWVTVDPNNPEMQDLRDAVDVRSPLWR